MVYKNFLRFFLFWLIIYILSTSSHIIPSHLISLQSLRTFESKTLSDPRARAAAEGPAGTGATASGSVLAGLVVVISGSSSHSLTRSGVFSVLICGLEDNDQRDPLMFQYLALEEVKLYEDMS